VFTIVMVNHGLRCTHRNLEPLCLVLNVRCCWYDCALVGHVGGLHTLARTAHDLHTFLLLAVRNASNEIQSGRLQ
jgi:hypothetical protein